MTTPDLRLHRYRCCVDKRQPQLWDGKEVWDTQEEFSLDAVDAWTAGVQVLEAWVDEHEDARQDPDAFRVRVWNVDLKALSDPFKTVPFGGPAEVVACHDLYDAKSEQAMNDAV
ncbi:hypothetical protein [Streptomyces mirabilis]|uniref:hypothetical protein n=1 Tax=Streptomyces mirabilis TaxID=68239 RepID=UPI00331F5AB1